MSTVLNPVRPLIGQLAFRLVTTRSEDIATLAKDRAAMCIASTIASAAAGQRVESARIIQRLEPASQQAEASVWFTRSGTAPARAARVNVTASAAAASDDSDMRSIAHFGEIATSVGLAIGEWRACHGGEVLDAMVLGYEIGGRIEEALVPGRMKRGFHGSVSTVFSAVATASRLLKMDVTKTSHALALAATSIGGLSVAADASWAREYHSGLSALLGIEAALAAAAGYTADLNVLEKPRGFLSAFGGDASHAITADWGEDWDIVTDMAIKLMPGAHPFHVVAEAAAQAAIDGDVCSEDVQRIVVRAGQLQDWNALPRHPRNLVDMAHSVAYFAGAAVVDRSFGWQHSTVEKMEDPRIARLQDVVSIEPWAEPLPDRFPYKHGCSVTLHLRDGTCHTSRCVSPRGGAMHVSWEDIDEKFRALTPRSGLPLLQIETALATIHDFEQPDGPRLVSAALRPIP